MKKTISIENDVHKCFPRKTAEFESIFPFEKKLIWIQLVPLHIWIYISTEKETYFYYQKTNQWQQQSMPANDIPSTMNTQKPWSWEGRERKTEKTFWTPHFLGFFFVFLSSLLWNKSLLTTLARKCLLRTHWEWSSAKKHHRSQKTRFCCTRLLTHPKC